MPTTIDKPNTYALRARIGVVHRWLPDKVRHRAEVAEYVRDTANAVCRGDDPWPLVFVGGVGSGKTCAALLLLDHFSGRYVTASGMAERVNDANFGRLVTSNGWWISRREVWQEWTDSVLPIMDELGSRSNVSDAQYEVVKRCIDEREGRPAVFISNLSLGELATVYDDRIASRLSAGTVIEFEGDRRVGNG